MPDKQLTLAFASEETEPEHAATSIEEVCRQTRYRLTRIRPPVKAHGGKYYLARKIVPVLMSAPGNPTEYLEPCAFGGSVFLAMPRFEREILGDVNPEVVQLWRTLAHEKLSSVLSQRLAETPYNEESFQQAIDAISETQAAATANFIVKSRFSRGGFGKAFAWSTRERGGKPGDENSWDTFRKKSLPQIIDRARGVEVVHDACWWAVWQSRHCINRLIYADPPYMKETRTAKKAYGPFEMTRLQHSWLVAALRAHSGPAAISGYRSTAYDRWLKDWRRLDFDMPNNSGQGKSKQRRCESMWINW